MSVYYNEWEPYPAQWLRNLIKAGHLPEGDVDERDIKTVQADDLKGYAHAHFFAGIGGWPLALRLAGWPDERPVWTGSCPCQPFSSQGNRALQQDERHLWKDWYRLIREQSPPTVFGEQVNDGIAAGWLDEVLLDMEAISYSCVAVDLPACAASAPHHRERVWFGCGHTSGNGQTAEQNKSAWKNARPSGVCNEANGWKRTGYKPTFPMLAHGLPTRVERLSAYGNAIVPQVAQAFIEAFMECRP